MLCTALRCGTPCSPVGGAAFRSDRAVWLRQRAAACTAQRHCTADRLRRLVPRKQRSPALTLKERRGIDAWYFGGTKGTLIADRDRE